MSKLVEIDFNPSRNTLRKFGVIAFVGFGMLALMAWTESFLFTFGLGAAREYLTGIFAALGIYCIIMGLIYPPANRAVFVGLSILTFPIGIIISYIIMGVLFFGVFGVIGVLMRLTGYDPMSRKLEEGTGSYWRDARPARPRSDYFKQY
jgi:hypothetical protein